MNETTFDNKTHILADLWLNYRDDEGFTDFIQYSDIGLPLAYLLSNGIVERTSQADKYIEDTFSLFLSLLGIEDTGFDELDAMLDSAGEK